MPGIYYLGFVLVIQSKGRLLALWLFSKSDTGVISYIEYAMSVITMILTVSKNSVNLLM